MKNLKKEILRKFFHLLEVPVVVVYSLVHYYWSQKTALMSVTVLFLVLLEIEYVRLEVKPKIPKYLNVFRKKELNNIVSSIFFIAATIIVFAVFDYSIALNALLLTVFGDLASALIGIKFGKHKIFRKKSLEGFLAGLAINILVGFFIFPVYPGLYLSMALVASLVELLTGKLDDNLTVPLFAGVTGYVISLIMGLDLSAFPGHLMWLFNFLPH